MLGIRQCSCRIQIVFWCYNSTWTAVINTSHTPLVMNIYMKPRYSRYTCYIEYHTWSWFYSWSMRWYVEGLVLNIVWYYNQSRNLQTSPRNTSYRFLWYISLNHINQTTIQACSMTCFHICIYYPVILIQHYGKHFKHSASSWHHCEHVFLP